MFSPSMRVNSLLRRATSRWVWPQPGDSQREVWEEARLERNSDRPQGEGPFVFVLQSEAPGGH